MPKINAASPSTAHADTLAAPAHSGPNSKFGADMGAERAIQIATFYRFVPIDDSRLLSLSAEIESRGRQLGVRGLVIMGKEGLNTTLSGNDEALTTFLSWISAHLGLGDLNVKRSQAPRHPFKKMKVKLRDEIVTLGAPTLVPSSDRHRHLSPEEWHEILSKDPDTVVLDTRNWYETRIGTFEGAIDPKIEEFQDFPRFLESGAVPKNKRVLIFCTGGIRCEKAILEMEAQGFENVWQLDGGILAYLEKFPQGKFQGECFVFDHRVAVDTHLEPTRRYVMCPHCGQPADFEIDCKRCGSHGRICVRCKDDAQLAELCSKNCAHHERLTPGRRSRPHRLRRS